MKYKHYAPEVPLVLVQENNKLQEIIDEEVQKGYRVGVLASSPNGTELRADQIIILGNDEEEMAGEIVSCTPFFQNMMK